jgi:hypothetical protein
MVSTVKKPSSGILNYPKENHIVSSRKKNHTKIYRIKIDTSRPEACKIEDI